MATVDATLSVPGSVHDAETLWYDTTRWVAWVDGLDSIVAVDGDWPRVGGRVVWESGPAGRGRVTEQVVGYEQLSGQTLEIEDDSIRGRQSVTFTPAGDGVEMDLRLEYKIKKRSIVMPIVDLLFIRNAVRASLRATLTRFGLELEAAQSRRGVS
jgi:uncharacterized membrane protein